MNVANDTVTIEGLKITQELRGRSAIVTGSTSGIGLGIAKAFAEAGMNVMLNGFGELDEIEEIRQDLEETSPTIIAACDEFRKLSGQQAVYSRADMRKPEQVRAMVERAHDEFGSLDVLVNNAGIQHVAPIEEFPAAKWDAILAINLSSAFHSIAAAMPIMKKQKFGRIINIASAHAMVASPYKSAYVAAKHGILGLTKTVALEGAEHGITANAICPGYVKTPLVEKQIPDTAAARGMSEEEVVKKVILDAQPTKEFVTTEQVGRLAVFLCRDGAASITGAALPVDGGWTAQ
ncbi:MAG: 3-hydroxybutyrate dehydrogenase [Alphaproteobacteria bacterium]|nr:3-hydroxybutyrate dehydrogenase [Alphaproteobacteria bacterium]